MNNASAGRLEGLRSPSFQGSYVVENHDVVCGKQLFNML
jgi:hypothetical protein